MTDTPPRRLQPLCEKIGRARLAHCIHNFYQRLLADAQLAPYFRALPGLESHIDHVTEFWWVAMGGRPDDAPVFDMVGRHAGLGITEPLLQRWLDLFAATLNDELPPELAAAWQQMAEAIAQRLRSTVVVATPPQDA